MKSLEPQASKKISLKNFQNFFREIFALFFTLIFTTATAL